MSLEHEVRYWTKALGVSEEDARRRIPAGRRRWVRWRGQQLWRGEGASVEMLGTQFIFKLATTCLYAASSIEVAGRRGLLSVTDNNNLLLGPGFR